MRERGAEGEYTLKETKAGGRKGGKATFPCCCASNKRFVLINHSNGNKTDEKEEALRQERYLIAC